MDSDTVKKYLISMLEMPETIEEFIESSKAGKNFSKKYEFLRLFVENMLNTRALAQILNQNSKEAIQKLLNTISFPHLSFLLNRVFEPAFLFFISHAWEPNPIPPRICV